MKDSTSIDNNREKQIYEINLKTNKEKTQFTKFLIYGTKIEVHINSFMTLLYWVSILELFLFLIGLTLFMSSPNNFGIFWAFITHVIRASLGFVLLKRIPNSHEVIENLKEYENSTVEDIENNIIDSYKNLLYSSESKVKPILITYFVFTIIRSISSFIP